MRTYTFGDDPESTESKATSEHSQEGGSNPPVSTKSDLKLKIRIQDKHSPEYNREYECAPSWWFLNYEIEEDGGGKRMVVGLDNSKDTFTVAEIATYWTNTYAELSNSKYGIYGSATLKSIRESAPNHFVLELELRDLDITAQENTPNWEALTA